MKFLITFSLLLAVPNAFAASSDKNCLQDAKKVARAMLLVNHPDMAQYRSTSAIIHPDDSNDPNNTLSIYVNYWAPEEKENAAVSYKALAIPSGDSKCGGIVSVSEQGE